MPKDLIIHSLFSFKLAGLHRYIISLLPTGEKGVDSIWEVRGHWDSGPGQILKICLSQWPVQGIFFPSVRTHTDFILKVRN